MKGNFFILGKKAEKYPEIVKETFNKGHLIGNHTYSHPKEGDGDFEKAEEILSNITGERTKFIRPPHLLTDLCRDYKPAINKEVKIISCDVFPHDYKSSAEKIKRIIETETTNGSIIGLHDGSRKDEELENRATELFKALPEILKNLKERFKIVRLDEMKL